MNMLLVIDMQNDFIDGALGTPEAVQIVPAVKARIEAAQAAGERIVFTRDTHQKNYLQTLEGQRLPVEHCIEGTYGWQISSELPVGDAQIVDKPTFGSYELAMSVAARQPERIELIGVCTDICVISNAMMLRAALPNTPIAVNAACCAGVTPAAHDCALDAMRACMIDII